MQAILNFMHPTILFLQDYPIVRYILMLIVLIDIAVLFFSRDDTKDTVTTASKADLTAIAGDDVLSTQLDLAKAYIEMNQKTRAKKILQQTLKEGNSAQQSQAQQLLNTL